MKRVLLMIGTFFLIIAVLMGVKFARDFTAMSREAQEHANELVLCSLNLSEIPDGSYVGNCDWGIISVETKVTVEDGQITSIDIAKHNSGRGKAAEEITNSVLSAQSLQVDVVSGATYSSRAILSAIQSALTDR